MTKVLRLDLSGTPTAWLSAEAAALAYTRNMVKWELGNTQHILRGGVNQAGKRSYLCLRPVIATTGLIFPPGKAENFNNRMLFKRDNFRCMYCGEKGDVRALTRDHIIPSSRGGKDIWENVVAACKRCNHYKANRTPEEANMSLLAIPFRPNVFEAMYLAQHTILADQMEYLEKRFSGKRIWQAA
ncbi:CRISPR-associated endonuclease Cas9 [Thalassocella blandensis]|nr:CRISPR-associated endonuclease Cas9 [Thalassocella blandensis]